MNTGPVTDDLPLLLRGDAQALERSASVLKLRARKPGSVITRAFCKVLRQNAASLRAEAAAIERRAA
jgi:hypothetical protein